MNQACSVQKIDRVNKAIEAQKRFIRSVPDPDNRGRAESNLMSLVLMRDEFMDEQQAHLAGLLVK